jgi:hypothetical protein
MTIQQILLGGSEENVYKLTNSLRFRRSASANLTRTPAGSSSQSLWTWSAWVKRGQLGAAQTLFSAYAFGSSDYQTYFGFTSDDKFQFYNVWGGASSLQNLITTQVFRDPSAWYHIVVNVGMAASTFLTAIQIFINGVQVTSFSTNSFTNANNATAVNSAQPHGIGVYATQNTNYFDGYLAEVNFVNGSQLLPISFGSTNAKTGVWQPARYTGTYGTNGFYLPFTDNSALTTSSNVGLGRDYSGNGNYWATNNISITAGVTYDSMTDVPTLTDATTANYCVLNPLDQSTNWTLSDANLKCRRSTGTPTVRATFALPSSGKYYFEYLQELGTDASNVIMYGLCSGARGLNAGPNQTGDYSLYCAANGFLVQNGVSSGNIGTIPSVNQIVQVAVDVDNSKMWFGINNSWYIAGGATTGDPATGANPTLTGAMAGLFPMVYVDATVNTGTVINFGQRPFAYTPPTGFVALNTFNLPTATIVKGSANFNIALDTGANIKTNSEALFPSNYFEWIKDYVNSNDNQLANIVTGNTAILVSNSGAAETTYTTPSGNSVGWVWKANGSAVSNANGSITSQVSANTSSGFSIVTFNGTGAAATVGHGLNVAPEFIIAKRRNNSDWWFTYSAAKGNTGTMYLNQTTDDVQSIYWNNTTPTSSVFSVGSYASSGNPYLALCFASIDGYSKFGSYSGNSSTDGTFVYLGFRARYIMIRKVGTGFWLIYDTSRDTYNVVGSQIYANLAQIDAPSATFDILSNGFKLRTSDTNRNSSGQTYFYAAFAENPFKNALAR